MARAAPPVAERARKPGGAARAGPVVQTRLAVGPARDRYELEADRLADRLTRGAGSASGAVSDSASGTAPPAISRLDARAARRAAAPERLLEEEDEAAALQRRGDGPAPAPAAAEAAVGRMQAAGGRPLAAATRAPMEAGLGLPLGDVRVHDGPPAAQAARAVGARAFTLGRDIFFGAGQYRPDTAAGRHLLAHELVHTEQQKGLAGSAQTRRLQRDATDPEPPREEAGGEAGDAGPGLEFAPTGRNAPRIVLDAGGTGGTIHLSHLQLPRMHGGFKGASNHPKAPGVPATSKSPIAPGSPYVYKGATARETQAAQEFQKRKYFELAEDSLEPALIDRLPGAVRNWTAAPDIRNEAGEQRRYLRLASMPAERTTTIIFGTTEELADHKRIKLPNWDRNGAPASFDVDHAQELQLGGLDGWVNFWLLDSAANQDSGREINARLGADITAAIEMAQAAGFWRGPNAGRKPSFEAIKDGSGGWQVEFAALRDLSVRNAGGPYWTRAEILEGRHLGHLVAMTEAELLTQGLILRGDRPAAVSIFTSQTGAFRRRFTVAANGSVAPVGKAEGIFGGFNFAAAQVNPNPGEAPYITRLDGTVFRRRRGQIINPLDISGANGIPVLPGEGLGFSGYLDNAALLERIRALPTEVTNTSPVTFTEAGFDADGNLFANGLITATKALFPGLEIPILIRGSDVYIDFPIPAERLNFGPVRVTEAALRLGAGENGVFLSGNAALAVDSVGTGTLEARVERGATILTGSFNFDLDFLDPAEATITYDYGADALSLTLRAGVREGRLPGIESGEVTASFGRDAIAVAGTLNLGAPLQGTTVQVGYSSEAGLSIGAENVALPVERIPGISSATASLHAQRAPDSGEWRFGGAGRAVLAIPGATGDIALRVDGALLTLAGNLTVAKGPASGSLVFTATNAPLDDAGNPVDGPPTGSVTVFGRGRAEITFGRVLRGAAEIELAPDASIRLRGTIGLPATFEVFPRRNFERVLLSVSTPDFPIWGVSVAGVGIGIFAFADARITFNAHVGPGQLVGTEVRAEMDLNAPADATVTGSARFVVPAYAGLRLDVGGGLRARIAVAYVEGRVGLDGELGIAADASAGVEIAWSRAEGLSVAADVTANARPRFRVGINARVTAGVDLWLTEVSKTWGPWRRTLGEFGPEMELGVTVPVRWNEREGLAFSLDDITVRRPQLDVPRLLKSSFEELV